MKLIKTLGLAALLLGVSVTAVAAPQTHHVLQHLNQVHPSICFIFC